jgi:hypothetical protein
VLAGGALYREVTGMMRVHGVLLAAALISGCASAPTASPPSHPLLDRVGRVVVVVSGQTRFTVVEHSAEPGRTFDEIVKWTPYFWLRPLLPLLHEGINQIVAIDRKTGADLKINPHSVVGETFARRLQASGQFREVLTRAREPLDEDRHRADALIRVSVPMWGLVRVREGNPPLFSAFTDVHAQIVMRETGVVVWERREDVTHPDRVPLETFTTQRDLARMVLLDVLERAGHRLGSELLYARSSGS